MLGSRTVLVGGVVPHDATSVGSSRLKIGDSGVPATWSPRKSTKNAPTVSPAQANPEFRATSPAIWRPDQKMYWSGVPLGQ